MHHTFEFDSREVPESILRCAKLAYDLYAVGLACGDDSDLAECAEDVAKGYLAHHDNAVGLVVHYGVYSAVRGCDYDKSPFGRFVADVFLAAQDIDASTHPTD